MNLKQLNESLVRILNEDKEQMSLKDFRNKMKELGYKVKTSKTSFTDLGYGSYVSVKVYDGNHLINDDICTKEDLEKYKEVFDILNNYKIIKETR